jgi:flagellar biosynthesis protein FlhF
MEVKTYRAATLQEALQLVREELGPEASVLRTREIRGGVWQWLRGQRDVEVTASTEIEVPRRLPPLENQDLQSHEASYSSAACSSANDVADAEVASLEHASAPHLSGDSPSLSATGATGAIDEFRRRTRATLPQGIQWGRSLVEELCASPRTTPSPELPASLFHLFTDLIDAELGEELARELVERARRGLVGQDLDDYVLLKSRILRYLEDHIETTGGILTQPGTRRIVALVGPTGVGKTTTIAKLAANFRLRDQRRVGLVTVDTYRIAAVEQLRTYADIIDLPMEVVSTPHDMRDALDRLADLDLILLDTAGRSPRDEVRIQELQAILDAARADEVHLVLSSTAGASQLRQTAEKFARVGVTSLLLTKLDEAAAIGNVFTLIRSAKLPVSYVTHGQNVPDDIEAADRGRLARRVLAGSGNSWS